MVSGSALAPLLAPLRPAELVLRDWVGPQLDAAMVARIAAADYGFNVDEYRRDVEDLRHVGRLPTDPSDLPEEVLSLSSWSTVERGPAGPEQERRHRLIRLFSCLFLVGCPSRNGRPVDSLTSLLDAAIELGPEAVDATCRFLAWCRLTEPGDWRDDPNALPFLTLALVVLCGQLPDRPTPDPVAGLLAAFVEELSTALDEENRLWSTRPIPDLLKLTAMGESRRAWRSLAQRCLIDGPAPGPGTDVRLARLGQAIRGDLVADIAELRPLLMPGAPPAPDRG